MPRALVCFCQGIFCLALGCLSAKLDVSLKFCRLKELLSAVTPNRYMYVCMCMSVYVGVCMCLYVGVCMCMYVCGCMYVYVCVRMCVCVWKSDSTVPMPLLKIRLNRCTCAVTHVSLSFLEHL